MKKKLKSKTQCLKDITKGCEYFRSKGKVYRMELIPPIFGMMGTTKQFINNQRIDQFGNLVVSVIISEVPFSGY